MSPGRDFPVAPVSARCPRSPARPVTMLLLARPFLSAMLPLLAAHSDSTTLRPKPPARDTAAVSSPTVQSQANQPQTVQPMDLALAPAIAPFSGADFFATTAAATSASAPATTATRAPSVLADGRVPVPAWAMGAKMGLFHAGRADSIVVEKYEHRMTLYAGSEAIGVFQVALGKKQGQKASAGDNRTPEGLYHIDARNPNSRFHLALHVSYPNADDVARAQKLGVSTGGDIMIHGLPNGQGAAGVAHREYDWTNGCVAVTDQEIEQIWSAVPVGTLVRIKP